MSLGLFQFHESYCRILLDFSDAEKEVIMILANMKNGTMDDIRSPFMILADGESNYTS